MRQQTAIVLALVVAAVSVIGAASYTQATVDRDANINVETDSAALVGLTVGGGITDNSITTTTNGELRLDLDGASGVNGNATFHYGADGTNTARTSGSSAIDITNNDDESRTFVLSYTGADTDGTNPNVQFDVYTYDSTNSALNTPEAGTVDEEGTTVSQTLAAGDTLYVFVTVDTATGDLDSTSDLSGTLTVTAS